MSLNILHIIGVNRNPKVLVQNLPAFLLRPKGANLLDSPPYPLRNGIIHHGESSQAVLPSFGPAFVDDLKPLEDDQVVSPLRIRTRSTER